MGHDRYVAIQAKLYDFGQNLNLGVIDYEPYLMTRPPARRRRRQRREAESTTPSPTPTGTSGCQGCSIVPGGHINLDTEWTLANSAYLVTGNLLVVSGVTLTIDPGVLVQFATNRGMQVNGTLIALGTATQPITFTSAQPAPAAGNWASIIFASGSVGATLDGNGNYLSGSTLQYVAIQYAGGNGATAALKIGGTGPYLANLSVSDSQTEGIDIQGGTVSMVGATIQRTSAYALNAGGVNLTLTDANVGQTGGVYMNSGTLSLTSVAITGTSGTGLMIDNIGGLDATSVSVSHSSAPASTSMVTTGP